MMFDFLKIAHRISRIATKWASVTSIDLRDGGQISKKAKEYVTNLKLSPEDAWTMALVNWMNGMPWPDAKVTVARGMIRFLDSGSNQLRISEEVAASARQAALAILAV